MKNIVKNENYAEGMRDELKKRSEEEQLSAASDLCPVFLIPYEKLLKKRDIEQFHTFCYTYIIFTSKKYLLNYTEDAGTLLLMKITDSLLAYQSKNVEMEVIPDESNEKKLPLSEMERHGLCYIGGYVMHKLYKKIKNSTKWR